MVFLGACSSEPRYIIKGKIEGADNITFYLKKRGEGQTVIIDSAIAKRGTFTIKGGKIEYPQLIQLIAGDTRKGTSFFLENTKITVTGILDSLYKADIKGSKTQDEYQSYVDSNKPLSDKYSKIYSEYQTANQEGNTIRVAELAKEAESLQTEMLQLQKNFVINNPGSFASPSLLAGLSDDMEADELESIINAMDTAVAVVPVIKELKARVEAMKVVSVGRKAPDFMMNDVDGKPVTLTSKIGSKLLLIDFWASWCVPCREENPDVVRTYNEFHKKGFDILGVSLDRSKDAWLKAIADDKLTWSHVSDLQYWNNSAAKLYAVRAIPASFLLDETGTIIAKNLRGDALYNKLNEVLGTK